MATITGIEIEYGKGDFWEWMNSFEEQSDTDIEEWQGKYYSHLEEEMKNLYPGASVEIDEGYDQIIGVKIRLTHDGDFAFEHGAIEEVESEINEIAASAGNNLDKILA